MIVIKRCLANFERAFGQKVSFHKSSIYFSPNLTQETAEEISLVGGIPIAGDLGWYLGMYLVHGCHSKQQYQQLLDRVILRLAGWKMKTLSLAGRATLASSVMTSMPIYLMQTARLPQSIISYLDKHTRRCIWGSNDFTGRVHLINWSTICKTKDLGGLGMKKAGVMNTALLGKLAWRLVQEPHALWS